MARQAETDRLTAQSLALITDGVWERFTRFTMTVDGVTRIQVLRETDAESTLSKDILAIVGRRGSIERATFRREWWRVVNALREQARSVVKDRCDREEIIQSNGNVFGQTATIDANGSALYDRFIVDMERLGVGDPNVLVFRDLCQKYHTPARTLLPPADPLSTSGGTAHR
jgi:hypothetical protein